MLIPVSVAGLAIDPRTEAPILLLHDTDGKRVLPIWIGVPEATAIAASVEGIALPRPLTHDLTQSLVDSLGGHIGSVAITSLVDSTFYASVEVVRDDLRCQVDARPSDAVALALRASAPIYVDDSVFASETTVIIDTSESEAEPLQGQGGEAIHQTHAERWQALLDHLSGANSDEDSSAADSDQESSDDHCETSVDGFDHSTQ